MNPLVTPAWLAARLHDPHDSHVTDPGTVVFDATLPPVGVTPVVDTRARYLAAHIPGALFFDIEELSDQATALPHMLPTPESFSASMSALGVSEQMTVVVYEQQGVFSAPRAWWMLRTFGVREVYVLDGGLEAWQQAGLPTETGESRPREWASFTAHLDQDAVRNFEDLQESLAARAQVLDARSAGRFNGIAPEPRAGLPSGHMPGATSVPFSELVEDGRMKTAKKLRDLFAARHIDLEQPITTTCGSGVTAAVVALGLEIAGAAKVNLYDGSWAEYAQHPNAVIETAG